MAKNEIKVVNSNVYGVTSSNVVVPDFKAINLGEEPRRLKIKVVRGKTKDGKKTFASVSGYLRLPVYDGDDFMGIQVKRLSVHFRKEAFKGCDTLSNPEDLTSGYLYVKAKGIKVPSVYKIIDATDENGEVIFEENGEPKKKYPEIWIHSDILGLQAFVTSQNALDVDENDDAVDAVENEETGELDAAEFDTEECISDYNANVEDEA